MSTHALSKLVYRLNIINAARLFVNGVLVNSAIHVLVQANICSSTSIPCILCIFIPCCYFNEYFNESNKISTEANKKVDIFNGRLAMNDVSVT